eukprot:GFUD01005057.1.p1 GENE.GFUD01005057.1~~GFUD01005057.1.p1  ORF type:complete len:384 (-),score=75.01 GFUD01005057.1:129-1280(-)
MGSEANSSEVELVVNCSEGTEDSWVLLDNIDVLVGGYGTIALATLGVCANILAISVFSKKSFKSNFNNLLIALAVFDLLFLVICITESVRRTFEDVVANSSSVSGFATQVHHFLFPYFLYPLHNILLTCSIFMTISISIERYLAIFHPLVYRNRSYSWNLICHILPVLALSIIINIPKFFESGVVYDTISGNSQIGITELRYDRNYVIYYQNWFRFLVLGLVPMLLLIFLNLRVFIAINSRKTSSKEMTYSTILLFIVAIFILCNMPRVALNFHEVLDFEQIEQCGPPVWSLIFSVFSNSLLPAINSTINFFIYFLAGKKFRNSLLNLVFCRDDRQDTVLSKTSFRTADTRLVGNNTDEAAKKVKEIIELEKKCVLTRSSSIA